MFRGLRVGPIGLRVLALAGIPAGRHAARGRAHLFGMAAAGLGAVLRATQYVAQTLQQMRNATPLTMAAPPAKEDVAVAGCESATASIGCPWETFAKSLQKAIDHRFVSMPSVALKDRP